MSECFSTSDGDWRCHTLSRIDVSSASDRPRPIRLFSCIVSTSCMSPKTDCTAALLIPHTRRPHIAYPDIHFILAATIRTSPSPLDWRHRTDPGLPPQEIAAPWTPPPSSLLTRTRPHTGYAFLDIAQRRSFERARYTVAALLAGAVGFTDAKREESAKPAVGSLLPQTDGDVFNADFIIPCTNRHIFPESYQTPSTVRTTPSGLLEPLTRPST